MSTFEQGQYESLADAWRARANRLDAYAKACRRDGDTREAQDAEQAATDYRIAADERELRQVTS